MNVSVGSPISPIQVDGQQNLEKDPRHHIENEDNGCETLSKVKNFSALPLTPKP